MDMIKETLSLLKLVLQARAPYDTGNLAINSIRIVDNAVYIGGEIADYAIFTNEPWINRTGKNPNEGWVQAAIMEAVPIIQKALKNVSMDDVRFAKKKYRQIIKERKQKMLRRLKQEKEKIQGASE